MNDLLNDMLFIRLTINPISLYLSKTQYILISYFPNPPLNNANI